MAETLTAESLTRVLYPDDTTSQGQGLRFVQEYFLVACALADLVRRFQQSHAEWRTLPEKVAIQLNDTHPTLAVPELMRILLDDAHLGWDEAWDLTHRTLAYTNHTLLPEALEKWPLAWFELMLPRHLEIIFEINRRLLDDVRTRFPGDAGRVARVSLEGMLLKPNMVIAGKECPQQASVADVALATRRCLRRHVPAAVPGIVFLSGGQDHLLATRHLNAINQLDGPKPWTLGFSFGRALQDEALHAWHGQHGEPSGGAAGVGSSGHVRAAALGTYTTAMEGALVGA